MENITESNKLIAEFMGWEFGRYPNLPNKCHMGDFNSHEEVGMDIRHSRYHKSWDWLMPVVDRIEGLYQKAFPKSEKLLESLKQGKWQGLNVFF